MERRINELGLLILRVRINETVSPILGPQQVGLGQSLVKDSQVNDSKGYSDNERGSE